MPMRYLTSLCLIFFQFFGFTASAQEKFLDTFIRKDGIYIVPPFEPWQQATMFSVKSQKGRQANNRPLLGIDVVSRVKFYSSSVFRDKKTEPYSYFRVLADLEAHDSSAYFQVLSDLPPVYQSFFSGLYHVEYNDFKKALGFFDNVLNTVVNDSLLSYETVFWNEATKKLVQEHLQYNAVYAAYRLQDEPRPDSAKLANLLAQILLPQYVMHKYILEYNYRFRKNDYDSARSLYDSVLAYTTHSRMKASLSKNREAVRELLDAKGKFIAAMRDQLYHYEIDYLYDHLDAWGGESLTGKELAEEAGFALSPRHTTRTDSIFTRWLKDTANPELLSKFEVLSFIKTPLDKAGRRFVMVKLGFDHDSTFQKYAVFLEKFKSKPIQQSVMSNQGKYREGNEYMLTKYFIAALYRQDDPVIRYELCLYLLEDAEGNVYAVDTLF